MFAYTALPFSLTPQISLALFFLSILFATAAGVTAFLLLASGNLQNLQDKFDHRKKSRTLPIVADNGEILATKDELVFHLDILETKLKNKTAELEAWKGKLNIAEMEMQKLNNASGEVRRHYMKLKTDVVKTEDDCKEIQKQIDQFRRQQAEVCPELIDKRGHSCSLLSSSKGISKTRSDTPPEAYGRVATVMKSLKSLSSIQHFKHLTRAMSHLLITTLSSIGIILPHEASYERRNNFGNVPSIFLQKNIGHKTDQWSKSTLDSLGQKDYIHTRSGGKKYIKVVNFPFPPKSPAPTLLSNMILWAIKQLRVKKETKDRAVNHCSEYHTIRLSTTAPSKSSNAEQKLSEKIADKLKTLIIFQFLEDDKNSKAQQKDTFMNNDVYRKLAKLLKVNDSLLSRLLSEKKNKKDSRKTYPKKRFQEPCTRDADISTYCENPSTNYKTTLSHLGSEKHSIHVDLQGAGSPSSKSKFLYVRSKTDTEESSKDNRKASEMEELAERVRKFNNSNSTSQLQKKRLEMIHMNDVDIKKCKCLKDESETPFVSEDFSTNGCHSKHQLYTMNSKISSIESEPIVEKKVSDKLEWANTNTSFDNNSTNRDFHSIPKSNTKTEITSKLTKEQMCIISITPTDAPINIVFETRPTKSEAVSCSLLKLRLSQSRNNKDIPQNVVERDHRETEEQSSSSIPNSSSTICINGKKSPTNTNRSPLTIQKKSRTADDMKIANTYSKLINKVSYSSHYGKNSKEQLRSSSNKVAPAINSEPEKAKENKSRNLLKQKQANGVKTMPSNSSQREPLHDKKSPPNSCNTSRTSQRKTENSYSESQKSAKSFTKNKHDDSATKSQNLLVAPTSKCTSEADRKTESSFKCVTSISEYRSPKHWQSCKE